MTVSYSVERFSEGIATAYERMFTGPDEKKGMALLRWRFEKNPHGLGYFALAKDEGQIVGMIGLVAAQFNFNGKQELTLHAIDTIVDPAYRGQGLFTGMGNAIYEYAGVHQAELLWGFPNDQAAKGWFGRLGWKKFGTVPFMFRPLRTRFFLSKIHRAMGRLDYRLARPPQLDAGEIRVLSEFDAAMEPLCARFETLGVFARIRDIDWLNWRLFANPDADYRTVGLFEGEKCVAALSTIILEKHGTKVCYVMEALAAKTDDHHVAKLLKAELSRATHEGAEVALAWCTLESPNYAPYRRAGFFNLPDRIRPIELFFGAKELNGQNIERHEGGRRWYLSYLDSDTV